MGGKPFNPFKAITVIIIVAALAVGGYFGYNYYKKLSEPISQAIDAIPENAAFFIEFKKEQAFWEKISRNNIWELLATFSEVETANENLAFLDSLLTVAKKENQIKFPDRFYLASFVADSTNLQHLFLFNIKDNLDKDIILNQVKKAIPKNKIVKESTLFDNKVFSCKLDSSRFINYTLFKGVFICGFEFELIKEAMIQLQSEHKLKNKPIFKRVYNSAGKHADATLFIQLPVFSKVMAMISAKGEADNVFDSFAQWAGVDIQIGDNDIVLNGFTAARDSLSDFLACFYKQKPQNNNIIDLLPSNTVYFVNYSFRDFETFYTRYKKYLAANNKFEGYKAEIDDFNKENRCNLSEDLVNWIGSEMCYLISAGKKITKDNRFALVNIIDKNKANSFFSKIRDNRKRSIVEFKNIKIYKLKSRNLLSVFFGDLYKDFEARYYCKIEDYILFSGSVSGAKQFINKYQYRKTLTDNTYFRKFAELIPGESNIFLYCNVYHAADIFNNNLLNENISKQIRDSLSNIKKIQAFAIQLNNDNKLFYSNIAVKYNAEYKSEPSILWETSLDTTIAKGPFLVSDHTDRTKEIFVTDVSNNIYLIENNGEIIWKRKLSSSLLGAPIQIDFFRNNKKQFVFNTTDSIYLVDRNGKDVEDYPIYIEKGAVAPVAVFDYEDKKDYRFLIPIKNREILNFDKDGNKILGWEYAKCDRAVTYQLKHFLMERIDYIVIRQNNNNIEIVDRRGKNKYENLKLKIGSNSELYGLSESDVAPSLVTTDKKLNVVRVYLEEGKVKNWFKPTGISKNHYFVFKDFDLDGLKDFIFLSGKKLKIYNQKKQNVFNYTFKNKIASAPLYFQTPDTTLKIGVTDKENKEIYLFTCEGKLKNGFPLKGDTDYIIDYMDDTGMLNLVVGYDSTILCFEIIE